MIIPEFFSVDNHDGTYSAYTVRHLSAGTFSGNTELKSALLSGFIREIPDDAFAGCSSLQFVYGSEIARIGNNAFSGCTSLGEFKVSSTVTSIGENAFQGVNSIIVNASSKDVVFGAIRSGAKRITINVSGIAEDMSNVTLEVPDSVEYFELQGGRKNFSGLKIHSDAGTTVLNGITITNSNTTPLEISSELITLNQVSAHSDSYALLLKGVAPTISLYGTSKLISSTANAVVCRNVTFERISSIVSSKLEITGNLMTYGEPSNASSFSFVDRGQIVLLSADEYESYIKGSFNIILDANGGTVAQNNIAAYLGLKTGTLVYYKWDYNAPYYNVTNRSVAPVRITKGTDGLAFVYFHANLSSTDHPYLSNGYCNNYNMPSYNCSSEFNTSETAGTTPRFFRFDYYTSYFADYQMVFQFQRFENRESSSPVAASNDISNVQRWVRYRNS